MSLVSLRNLHPSLRNLHPSRVIIRTVDFQMNPLPLMTFIMVVVLLRNLSPSRNIIMVKLFC